jgi:hypothetical protein
MVIELVTKITVPEYCTDIWLFTPFLTVCLPDFTHYSYLNSVGPLVIVVAKGNMGEYYI